MGNNYLFITMLCLTAFLLQVNFGITQNIPPDLDSYVQSLLKREDEIWGIRRASNIIPDSVEEKTKLDQQKKETQRRLDEAKKNEAQRKDFLKYLEQRNQVLQQQVNEALETLRKKNDSSNDRYIQKLTASNADLQKARDDLALLILDEKEREKQTSPGNFFISILDYKKAVVKWKCDLIRQVIQAMKIKI